MALPSATLPALATPIPLGGEGGRRGQAGEAHYPFGEFSIPAAQFYLGSFSPSAAPRSPSPTELRPPLRLMSQASELSSIALALGRIPTGLYIVATRQDGRPLGFVGSFLMQVGFSPPTLCLAIGRTRSHLTALRESGRFCVSILDRQSQDQMGAFFRRYEGTHGPFDHVEHADTPGGVPYLSRGLAWLDCRCEGEHDVGDHVVVFGVVEHAQLLRPGDPALHLRRDGLAY